MRLTKLSLKGLNKKTLITYIVILTLLIPVIYVLATAYSHDAVTNPSGSFTDETTYSSTHQDAIQDTFIDDTTYTDTEEEVLESSPTTEIEVTTTQQTNVEDASPTTEVWASTEQHYSTESGNVSTSVSTVLNPDTPHHTDSSYETNALSTTNLLKVLWDSTGSSVPATTMDSWIMSSNTSGSWVNSSTVSFVTAQDVTVADEVDTNSYWSASGTKVTATQLPRGDDSYLYMDMGSNFFDESFKHRFKINTTAADPSTGGTIVAWALDNSVGSYGDIEPDAGFYMLFTGLGGGSDQVRLALTSGLSQIDEYNGTIYVPYYIQIERKGYLGTTLECKIYSDSGFSSLLDTLSITIPTTSWRHFYVGQSLDTVSDPTHWLSGYMDEFLLYQAGAPQVAWSQYDITNPATGDTVVGYRGYANNSQGNWGDTGILTFTTPAIGNVAPTVDSFTITNLDNVREVIADGEKYYHAELVCSDSDGVTTLDTLEFAFQVGPTWLNVSYDCSSTTWTRETDIPITVTGMGTSDTSTSRTLVTGLMFSLDLPESYHVTVYGWCNDTIGSESGWSTFSDVFDVVHETDTNGGSNGGDTNGDDEEEDDEEEEPEGCPYDFDQLSAIITAFRELTLTELHDYCERHEYEYSKFDTKDDIIKRVIESWGCSFNSPFEECELSQVEIYQLEQYLWTLSIEELQQYCDDMGISYKPWGSKGPYILLIIAIGYHCEMPDLCTSSWLVSQSLPTLREICDVLGISYASTDSKSTLINKILIWCGNIGGEVDVCEDYSTLYGMDLYTLRKICMLNGIYYEEGWTRTDLVQAIIIWCEAGEQDPQCELSDSSRDDLLNYLMTLSLRQLIDECEALGIVPLNTWRTEEPYIIAIFTVGYHCPVPDWFYEDDFNDDDWDDDGIPNDIDEDPFDPDNDNIDDPFKRDFVELGQPLPIPDLPWIQRWGAWIISILLIIAFLVSQMKSKKGKKKERGRDLVGKGGLSEFGEKLRKGLT